MDNIICNSDIASVTSACIWNVETLGQAGEGRSPTPKADHKTLTCITRDIVAAIPHPIAKEAAKFDGFVGSSLNSAVLYALLYNFQSINQSKNFATYL